MNTKTVASTQQTPNNSGVFVNLENAGTVISIFVGLSVLAGIAITTISRINKMSYVLAQIEKTLSEQVAYTKKLEQLDRDLASHIQEYINRKDIIQMVLGQLNEKIDHKFKRAIFYSRDIQKYLQRKTDFKIREYEETTQGSDE